MILLETKQSGGELLPHSDLWGRVFRGRITQHTNRDENRYLECYECRDPEGCNEGISEIQIRCSGCAGGQVGQWGHTKSRGL